MARDPVCGKEVDELRARGVAIFGRTTYYFCSTEHRDQFANDPARRAADAAPIAPIAGESSGRRRGTPQRGSVVPSAAAAESAPASSTEAGASAASSAEETAEDTGGELPRRGGLPRWLIFAVLAVAAAAVVAVLALRHH